MSLVQESFKFPRGIEIRNPYIIDKILKSFAKFMILIALLQKLKIIASVEIIWKKDPSQIE